MARIITGTTFRPLDSFTSVRLQQNVPVADADWNESDDIRAFERRVAARWFTGDGVPESGDAFRIGSVDAGADDDFWIYASATSAADPLSGVGRITVDGLDLMIEADIRYRDQRMHISKGASAQNRAQQLGASVIEELPISTPTGWLTVYLDVWGVLTTIDDDVSLAGLAVVNSGGLETCARMRREWVVRARDGFLLPQAGEGDYAIGHAYSALARVRRSGQHAVVSADITDIRERRLLLPPSTLAEDVFGVTPRDYRRSAGRPPADLRSIVNALLRGELPGTRDAAISPDPATDYMTRAVFLDGTGGITIVWASERVVGGPRVFATRLSLANPSAAFGAPPLAVTSAVAAEPHAAALAGGDVIVAYRSGSEVRMKRGPLSVLPAASERVVAGTTIAPGSLFVKVVGDVAIVFWVDSPGTAAGQYYYRRYRPSDDTWIDGAPVAMGTPGNHGPDLHVESDGAAGLWIAHSTGAGGGASVIVRRFSPTTGALGSLTQLDTGAASPDQRPFLLNAATLGMWLFWQSGNGITYSRFDGTSWTAPQAMPNTVPGEMEPAAIVDVNGYLWVFWSRGVPGDLYTAHFDPRTSGWGASQLATVSVAGDDRSPSVLADANGIVWLFWRSDRTGSGDLYYRALFAAI